MFSAFELILLLPPNLDSALFPFLPIATKYTLKAPAVLFPSWETPHFTHPDQARTPPQWCLEGRTRSDWGPWVKKPAAPPQGASSWEQRSEAVLRWKESTSWPLPATGPARRNSWPLDDGTVRSPFLQPWTSAEVALRSRSLRQKPAPAARASNP